MYDVLLKKKQKKINFWSTLCISFPRFGKIHFARFSICSVPISRQTATIGVGLKYSARKCARCSRDRENHLPEFAREARPSEGFVARETYVDERKSRRSILEESRREARLFARGGTNGESTAPWRQVNGGKGKWKSMESRTCSIELAETCNRRSSRR